MYIPISKTMTITCYQPFCHKFLSHHLDHPFVIFHHLQHGKKHLRSEMQSRASAAVVLWVLPFCVVGRPPQRPQFPPRCLSGMSLHRQLQVLQLVPDPRWERFIGVQKLKRHKWMQLLGDYLSFIVMMGDGIRKRCSEKERALHCMGCQEGELYKIVQTPYTGNPRTTKINLVLSWDLGYVSSKKTSISLLRGGAILGRQPGG